MTEITPAQVSTWYASLFNRLPATAAGAYRLLATICNTAVREDVLERSPCRVEGGATEHSPERPILSRSEVQLAVDAVPAQYRCALLLAAWCQMRRSEVLALQRGDVDLVTGSVKVSRAWVITQEGVASIERPKSNAGYRTLFTPPLVAEALKTHLNNFVAEPPTAWLFPTTRGSWPLSHRTFSRVWERARDTAGHPELRFHDLRHSGLVWFALLRIT